MAKTKTAPKKSQKTAPRPHLPDPKNAAGRYRPFASDPGWDEAWWWLGLPLAVALLVILTGFFAPDIYNAWIIPKGYGVLEFSQFLIMIVARVTLELGVLIGGILIPAAAWFRPQIRASRFALFFPAAALVPTALLALCFKLLDEARARELVLAYERPSESIEFYLYFFILAYLIVFSRRIGELETDEGKSKT